MNKLALLLSLLASPAIAQAPDLAVMSFNIRYGTANDGINRWENRREMFLGVIRSSAADILAVQEALRFQLDEVGRVFPSYAEIGVGRDDGKTAGEYSAILYRRDRLDVMASGTFWFSDTPDVPGSMHWGNRITRICTWARMRDRTTGGTFFVYNVHLDHESQPSRERSASLLARRIADRETRDPVIVAGDFNAGESNPAVRFFSGAPIPDSVAHLAGRLPEGVRFVDSFRVLHPEARIVGTFNGFRGDTTGEKIDYVFVSPEWQVIEASIDRTGREGRYPSDHFPVTARLRAARE